MQVKMTNSPVLKPPRRAASGKIIFFFVRQKYRSQQPNNGFPHPRPRNMRVTLNGPTHFPTFCTESRSCHWKKCYGCSWTAMREIVLPKWPQGRGASFKNVQRKKKKKNLGSTFAFRISTHFPILKNPSLWWEIQHGKFLYAFEWNRETWEQFVWEK